MDSSQISSPYFLPPQSQPKSNNKLLLIGGGVMVVIILILVFIFSSSSSDSIPAPATSGSPATSNPLPSCCPSNYIKDGEFCRDACTEGLIFIGGECIQKCPEGYTDDEKEKSCKKDAEVVLKKTTLVNISNGSCPEGYTIIMGLCRQNCPIGYQDDGLICNKNFDIFKKQIIVPKTIAATNC